MIKDRQLKRNLSKVDNRDNPYIIIMALFSETKQISKEDQELNRLLSKEDPEQEPEYYFKSIYLDPSKIVFHQNGIEDDTTYLGMSTNLNDGFIVNMPYEYVVAFNGNIRSALIYFYDNCSYYEPDVLIPNEN